MVAHDVAAERAEGCDRHPRTADGLPVRLADVLIDTPLGRLRLCAECATVVDPDEQLTTPIR